MSKCTKCGTEFEAKFCPNCGTPAEQTNATAPQQQPAYASQSGNCPNQQYTQPTYQQQAPISQPNIIINNTNTNSNTNMNAGAMFAPKSKIVALILCILFGWLGVHRFYVGKTGSGILYLLTCGLLFIGVIIDFISILTGGFRDKNGMFLK